MSAADRPTTTALGRVLNWGSDRTWLAAGLALRAVFALRLGERLYQTDEAGFVAAARQWASSGIVGVEGRAAVLPPVPSVFFGTFFKLGPSLLWPRLGQAAAGALAAWMIGRSAGALTGSPKAGRAALILACVYPFFIYYSGMLMSETLYTTLIVAGLWALCASLAEDGRRTWPAAAAGFLLGAAALCRAEGAPIFAVIWLAALGVCAAGRWRWRALLAAVACWALVLGLWAARNRAVSGRFSLDNHGGLALLHGTMLFDLNEIDTEVAMEEFSRTPLYKDSLALDDGQRDRLYLRTGLRFMADHPARTARQWARKFVNFWRFTPRADKAYAENAVSRPEAGFGRGALVAISLLFEPALILGGLCGLWTLRRRWATLFPQALFLLGTMGVHMISVSQMRYRLPVMPVLILGAASLWARSGPGGEVRAQRP